MSFISISGPPLLSGWFLPPFSGFPVGYDFSCPGGGYDCWGWNTVEDQDQYGFCYIRCPNFHAILHVPKTWLVKKKVDFGSLFLKIQWIPPVKSNIDTQNSHVSKEPPAFQGPSFWGPPAVSFREWSASFSFELEMPSRRMEPCFGIVPTSLYPVFLWHAKWTDETAQLHGNFQTANS